ncbi:hypothetical protein [Singulisphaera sp. PoT]|uniref:hypothetical protein n=1 Tax=Singulisphaera sp. PoT TaxID=3411797 RepID=UPI003BF47CDC
MSLQVETLFNPIVRVDASVRLEPTVPVEFPRNESRPQEASIALTCRDVIDGVCQRLAKKGHAWD